MQFSVLMSLYFKERPEFLRESLYSVFCQTLPPNEVILVEDGPITEELNNIVKEFSSKYPQLKTIKLPVNGGLGKALNEGLKHCSYEIIARMDTDDISKPDRFEKQINVFNKFKDVDVVGAWIEEFKENSSNIVSVRKVPEFNFEIKEFAKKRNPMSHPAVMFRKSSILFAGGYRHFPLFEDYYLWIRLLMNGSRFYNIQECLLSFRLSPDMFMRRGGFKYAVTEFRFQNHIRIIGFINWSGFIINELVRFPARIVPNSFRAFLYKRIRKQHTQKRIAIER